MFGHRVAYHRMTGDQVMLLLTILIKNDVVFSSDDGLNHLAGGLRYSSPTGMCLALWAKFSLGRFSFETSGKPDVFSEVDSDRYIASQNRAFLF